MKFVENYHHEFKFNNFDLLRLIFAMMVFFVHMAELSSLNSLEFIKNLISSSLAVKSFFVISGFLIVRSYNSSSSLSRYFEKRFFRIYPAYLFVIIAGSLLLMLVSSKSPRAYFSIDWLKYVAFNLFFLNFLQPSLPGVFDELRTTAINGALWTLKIEVMFYVSVPIIVFLCSRYQKFKTLSVLYFFSIFYFNLMMYLFDETGKSIFLSLSHQFPAQLSYFIGGAILYYYFDNFKKFQFVFLFAALLGQGVDYLSGLVLFEPLSLSVGVLIISTMRYMGNFSKYGDFSYGLYILHFPIIQTLLALGFASHSPLLFVILSILLVFSGSFLLWHCVEKRFLSLSSHYK